MEDSLETPLLGGPCQQESDGDNQSESEGAIREENARGIQQLIERGIQNEYGESAEVAKLRKYVDDRMNKILLELDIAKQDLISSRAQLSGATQNLADETQSLAHETQKVAAATEKLAAAGQKVAAAIQAPITGVDTLPYMSLVYALICMALTVLFVFGAISDFKATDGTPVGTLTDAFYIASVMVFTVGYGDIIPQWDRSIALCDMLSIFGGGFIQFILQHFVSVLAQWLYQRYLSKVENRGCRSLYLVISAVVMILVIILSGMLGCYIFEWERLSEAFPSHSSARIVLDMFHLTVMTMTTVGYGDFAFTTACGRAFAAVWIPIATTFHAVAISVMIAAILGAISHCRREEPESLLDMEAPDW